MSHPTTVVQIRWIKHVLIQMHALGKGICWIGFDAGHTASICIWFNVCSKYKTLSTVTVYLIKCGVQISTPFLAPCTSFSTSERRSTSGPAPPWFCPSSASLPFWRRWSEPRVAVSVSRSPPVSVWSVDNDSSWEKQREPVCCRAYYNTNWILRHAIFFRTLRPSASNKSGRFGCLRNWMRLNFSFNITATLHYPFPIAVIATRNAQSQFKHIRHAPTAWTFYIYSVPLFF